MMFTYGNNTRIITFFRQKKIASSAVCILDFLYFDGTMKDLLCVLLLILLLPGIKPTKNHYSLQLVLTLVL
jgi:hypothetical protein